MSKERLVELLKNKPYGFSTYEEFADYLLANGVIVLPFKIGQTLYDISEFYVGAFCPEIYELKSDSVTIEKVDEQCFVILYDGCYIHCNDIGETILFSREEAEAKLKEMKHT